MHKIPLCETLSKCVMTGLRPEVRPQSLSVEAALQFPFLTSISMKLSIMRANSGHWQVDTENTFNPSAISKELFSLTCRDAT